MNAQIKEAIILAKNTILLQEGAKPKLDGWYIKNHSGHCVYVNVKVYLNKGVIYTFDVLVQINLMTNETNIIS